MASLAKVTGYTKMGMNAFQGNPVVGEWDQGSKYYTKKLTDAKVMMAAYAKLKAIGVGVPYEALTGGRIRMTGGHTLEKLVARKMVGATGKAAIVTRLQEIHATLKQHKWAHTDVKPANVVVKFKNAALTKFDVWLIDNDYAAPFGQKRLVGTPAFNIKTGVNDGTIDAKTDDQGFKSLYSALQ
jgi:hypothetical protein